jgi:small conductance mechanosensitive channel
LQKNQILEKIDTFFFTSSLIYAIIYLSYFYKKEKENMSFQDFIDMLFAKATDLFLKLLAAAVILVVGRFLVKWVMKILAKTKFAKNTDATVVRVLFNFISAGLYVLLAVTVVGILGVPMASLVALIASAGVAIGLALQGALSNLAGGIMIMILRPFHIGNFVEIDGVSGTVKDVGIFYTVINTADNKVITIPNGNVMANSITNYSKNDTRRVDLVFGVAYGSDVERVKAILLEEADKHELALKDPAPFARLTEQGDNSLDFTLRVWANAGDFWTLKLDLLESINKRLEEEGIEIPYNQLDVHIKNEK